MISEKMKINDCVTLQVGLYFVPVCFKLCSHLKKSESLSRPDHVLSEPIGITCNCPHLGLIVLTFQPLLIY